MVLQLGSLTLTLSPLRLGQLKKVRAEAHRLMGLRTGEDVFPLLDDMVAVIHAAASDAHPDLTREAVAAASDALPFDTGLSVLVEGMTIALRTTGLTASGDRASGEAARPANPLILPGSSEHSTAPSSPPPAGDSPTLTP